MQEPPFWQNHHHQLLLQEFPCNSPQLSGGSTQTPAVGTLLKRALESPAVTIPTQNPSLQSADSKSHINKLPAKGTKLLLLIMAGNFSPCSNTASLAPRTTQAFIFMYLSNT